jgi:Uma2 family endonuclease
MHVAVQTIDADAFFALSLPDTRAELVRGEVVRMTPAGGQHGVVALRIGARLLAFVEARDLGTACAAETGFLVARNPDTVRAPDAAFVSRERMAGQPAPKKFWAFAPDLAVEVVSPSEGAEEVQERVCDWFAGGSKIVWLLYPGLATAHVFRSPTEVSILGARDVFSGEDLLPGFTCPVAELFR